MWLSAFFISEWLWPSGWSCPYLHTVPLESLSFLRPQFWLENYLEFYFLLDVNMLFKKNI